MKLYFILLINLLIILTSCKECPVDTIVDAKQQAMWKTFRQKSEIKFALYLEVTLPYLTLPLYC